MLEHGGTGPPRDGRADMSAFIVSKTHLDAIVRWATDERDRVYVRDPDKPGHYRSLTRNDADWLGRMLWAANVTSIEYRYPDTREGGEYPGTITGEPFAPEAYTLGKQDEARPVERRTYSLSALAATGSWAEAEVSQATPAQILKLCDSLDYQSCEHPDWEGSAAWWVLYAIRNAAWSRVPGYEAAEWAP